jgi:hypothetical protein
LLVKPQLPAFWSLIFRHALDVFVGFEENQFVDAFALETRPPVRFQNVFFFFFFFFLNKKPRFFIVGVAFFLADKFRFDVWHLSGLVTTFMGVFSFELSTHFKSLSVLCGSLCCSAGAFVATFVVGSQLLH